MTRAAPEPATTAVDRIHEALRAEVLGGRLQPGEPLREEIVAARFGASRHTVRSAFLRLAAERLAVAEPYRGVRVTSFGPEEIRALQELRAALEVEAVRLALERHDGSLPDAAVAVASAAADRLAALARREAVGEPVDWLDVERAHADFHRALVEASESPRLIETHAGLAAELQLFLLQVRPHYRIEELVTEHRALVDDIRARGGEAIRDHLEHSTRLLLGS